MIYKMNDQEFSVQNILFQNEGNLTYLIIKGPFNKKDYSFEIKANGGKGSGKLIDFYHSNNQEKMFKIPLIFGGNQIFSIYKKEKEIYHQLITNDIEKSRFYCFNGNWTHRICVFRDICFDNTNLTFISPYNIISDSPFLVLGGRSPPYDKKRDRIYKLNVNVSKDFTIPEGREVHDGIFHYASTYYNMQMLFHSLFDFSLPLFYTMIKDDVFKQLPDERSVIIPRDAQNPTSKFVQSFTKSFSKVKSNHCYKNLIVGIYKVKDITGKYYQFPYNFTHLLHPYIFKQFNLTHLLSVDKNNFSNNKPIILFSGRKTSKRNLVNYDELLDALQKEFAEYEIESIFYEEHDMAYQIEHTYRSSIMIGIHGSGLSHVAWMRPNTTMIEILPYKFNCRDWYERTCNVSGVNYFKYIPLDKEESPNPSYEAIKCWNASNGCEGYCLDALRDQNIKANKTRFIELIRKATLKSL